MNAPLKEYRRSTVPKAGTARDTVYALCRFGRSAPISIRPYRITDVLFFQPLFIGKITGNPFLCQSHNSPCSHSPQIGTNSDLSSCSYTGCRGGFHIRPSPQGAVRGFAGGYEIRPYDLNSSINPNLFIYFLENGCDYEKAIV